MDVAPRRGVCHGIWRTPFLPRNRTKRVHRNRAGEQQAIELAGPRNTGTDLIQKRQEIQSKHRWDYLGDSGKRISKVLEDIDVLDQLDIYLQSESLSCYIDLGQVTNMKHEIQWLFIMKYLDLLCKNILIVDE